MLKKLGAIAMTTVVCCMPLIAGGCGGPEVVDPVKEGASVLYVNNYSGGFGEAWMKEIETRFEETYATTSFEPNKVGVDIRVNPNKDNGQSYLEKVDMMQDEVFFPEKAYYYDWVNYKDGSKMLDITDIVTTANADDGGKTIESKLTQEEKDFYKINNKYYAIPHHEHQVGLVYNIDLFEKEELYFAKNGVPSEKDYTGTVAYVGAGEGNKSAGPDGTYGTSDDGLPATYDEFFMLCDYMSNPEGKNIVPFLWNGKTRVEYIDWFLSALTANYEGAEQTKLNYTYNGTAKNLIQITDSGEIQELADETITSANGYKIYSTAGRYYALEFMDRVISNPLYYDGTACFGSMLHTEAQYQYLLTGTQGEQKKYAFLVEGNWWENEASGSFDKIVKNFGSAFDDYSKTGRKFGFMPLPKATSEQIGQASTIPTTDVTFGFIKSSIAPSKIELAKKFLQFCYTDTSLNNFTKATNLPAAPQYELADGVYENMSVYAQGVWDVKNNVVKPYSLNPILLNNYSKHSLIYTFSVNGERAIDALESKSAKDYFKELYGQYSESKWTQSYQQYFAN